MLNPEEFEELYEETEESATIPTWFKSNYKTINSRNITIQDWNTIIEYLQKIAKDDNTNFALLNISKEQLIGVTAECIRLASLTFPIIDNLESTSTTAALSANMGRVLKGYIDTLTSVVATKANVSDVNTALATKANISYVDTALATKADKSDFGYIKLSSSSGTLTDAQYAEVDKPYCIIIFDDVYYKDSYDEGYYYFKKMPFTSTSSAGAIILNEQVLIKVNEDTKAFEKVYIIRSLYSKDKIDTLLSDKQNLIDSSNKLSSDLVNDVGATNKFATAVELAQIATNTTNIATKADKSDFGYIELSNTSGTLTDAQYAEVQKKYCLIKLIDWLGNETFFYKQEMRVNSHYICTSLTIGYSPSTLEFYYIYLKVNDDKTYSYYNQTYYTYHKNKLDTLFSGKQDTLSGSTSIDITSNVVSVKNTYVEGFFATDLEVSSMLEEVFG